MEVKPRFTLGKQSSLKPDRQGSDAAALESAADEVIDPRVRLMYLASEGDMDGIKELLDSGTNVNFKDIDGRTALHVAACQGLPDVVQLLLLRGAAVDPQDRWGSTVISLPLHFSLYIYVCVCVCMCVFIINMQVFLLGVAFQHS